jgi:hypothetical protein
MQLLGNIDVEQRHFGAQRLGASIFDVEAGIP